MCFLNFSLRLIPELLRIFRALYINSQSSANPKKLFSTLIKPKLRYINITIIFSLVTSRLKGDNPTIGTIFFTKCQAS